jgi:hypothetical protein
MTPAWKDYEYFLAEIYQCKRNPFSGAGKHEKLDCTSDTFMIEAKTAPIKDPSRFVIQQDEFFKYHRLAHHKGKAFIFAVQFSEYSMSYTTWIDAGGLGIDVSSNRKWMSWKTEKNRSGSHTLLLPTYIECSRRSQNEGYDRWFVLMTGWRESLIGMPTHIHAEEIRK